MNSFEIPDELTRYAEEHTSEEEPVLKELYRETYLKTVHPQMIAGPLQGTLLKMISRMIGPRNILEIGTFTGYSTICLARGLASGGKIITIEVNDELEDISRPYFHKAGLEQHVQMITGDARSVVPQLNDSFDLVFIDGNKEHYFEYYECCMDKTCHGGYLLIDNVLWGGKVADPRETDQTVQILREFNAFINNDQRVENVLLTVRDGLLLLRKH